MSATTDQILESLKSLSLLEASELVKQIEEAFGVSAAASAGVVMAAPGAAAGGGEAAEEEGGEAEPKETVIQSKAETQKETMVNMLKTMTIGDLFKNIKNSSRKSMVYD